MKVRRGLAAVAMLLLAGGALSGPAAAAEVASIYEQKIRLVEGMLGSPKAKAIAEGEDGEAKGLLVRAQELLAMARQSLAAGNTQDGGRSLDESLKLASQASSRYKGSSSLASSLQQQQNTDLIEQVRSYRPMIADAARARGDVSHPALPLVDLKLAEAQKLVSLGQHGEANRLLGEAYQLAASTLSELRAGQTVTLQLKFDTPADEYAYELRRYDSNIMLVDMMRNEGKGEQARAMVDRFTGEAARLKTDAERQAASGDHAGGIKTLEQATDQLMRALQAMGLPVLR